MRQVSPRGRLVEVGGRQLWTDVAGTGPAVVFLAGAGGMGLDYLPAHERVAGFATSVLHDRGGTGWSDDVDLPRSLAAVVDEVRALLATLAVPAPYVLVGHSLGGAYAQRYAQLCPEEVAALLLVEPLHADWDAYMPDHLKMAARPVADVLPQVDDGLLALARRQIAGGMFDPLPDDVRAPLIERHLDPDRVLTGVREGANVLALLDELRAGGPLPDVPLTVLSGTAVGPEQTVFVPEEVVREQIAGSQKLFAAIADAAPRGEHISLPDASHVSLPIARADAVSEAARALLTRATARP